MESPYYAAFCSVSPAHGQERSAEIARSSGGYDASFLGPVQFSQLDGTGSTHVQEVIPPTSDILHSSAANFEEALQSALHHAEDSDWTQRLEAVLELPADSKADNLARSIALHALTSEFEAVCTVIAAEIVAQLARPAGEWHLPAADSMGGVAGGQKFVVGNIFFKFARDSGIYGGDEGACKAAKHELRSLRQLLTTNTSGLAFPLMCTVDLAGFRLVCVSKLPISDATLVYGSADAGRTVHARDPVMNQLMASACSTLGLGPHNVGRARVDEKNEVVHDCITMWGPIDIEGHSIVTSKLHWKGAAAATASGVGGDANTSYPHASGDISRYVLDVARLYPPIALASIPRLARFGMVVYCAGAPQPTFSIIRNSVRSHHLPFSAAIMDEDLSPQTPTEQLIQRCLVQQLPPVIQQRLCTQMGEPEDSISLSERDPAKASWIPCQMIQTQFGALYVLDQNTAQKVAAAQAGMQDTPGTVSGPQELQQHNQVLTSLGLNEKASAILGFRVNGPAAIIKDSGAVFFKLLRPEAVATSPFALSSDAFTSFGCCSLCASGECHHGSRAEHQKVAAVTNHVLERSTREMAQELLEGSLLFPDGHSLVREMHSRGLNLSFMGYLLAAFNRAHRAKHHGRDEAGDSWVRQLIHIEMTARTLRSMLNERLRERVRALSAVAGQSGVDTMQVAKETLLQFVVEAFFLPSVASEGAEQESKALWDEVVFRGHLKFSTWAVDQPLGPGKQFKDLPTFLAYGVSPGMLMTRFFVVAQVQETHADVQALLNLCVGVRTSEVAFASARLAAEQIVKSPTSAASTPLLARTKSMFGADLVEKSLIAFLSSVDEQAADSPAHAGSFSFLEASPPERLLCGILHSFRCPALVVELAALVPHLCPQLSVLDASEPLAQKSKLSTPAAFNIFTMRLMQLTQEACRKNNFALLNKWGPVVSDCIHVEIPLTVQACAMLSVHGQCLEALGQTASAITTIRRGLKYLQRYMPMHPTLGQLSCSLARSLLSSDSNNLRAIAALALDDAFRVFNRLYSSLNADDKARDSEVDAPRTVSAVDVLISVLLMGMADKVGVHLGSLLETLEGLATSSPTADKGSKPSLCQLSGALEYRDGQALSAVLVQRSSEAKFAQQSFEKAPEAEAQVMPPAPPTSLLQIARSDSTALAALDDIDTRCALAGADTCSSEALPAAQRAAVVRCIGRSKACMHMLEEFLGTPKNYFRGHFAAARQVMATDLSDLQRPPHTPTSDAQLQAVHRLQARQQLHRDDGEFVAFILGDQRRTAGDACLVYVVSRDACWSDEVPVVVLWGPGGSIQAAVRRSTTAGIYTSLCMPYLVGEYSVRVSVGEAAAHVHSSWGISPAETLGPATHPGQATAPVTILVEPGMIDAGCCEWQCQESVERGQIFLVGLTLRDTYRNRRAYVTDKPCVRLSAPGSYGGKCPMVPSFGAHSSDAAVSSGAGSTLPLFSLRQLAADTSTTAPNSLSTDWSCAISADTLVDHVSCSWNFAGAYFDAFDSTRVRVDVPQSNDSTELWCDRSIPGHMLAGAMPAKLCTTCAQSYSKKCLRCGQGSFFGQRRLHVCSTCSLKGGTRSSCARCSSFLHFPASNVDAVECSKCSRSGHLRCVARK